MASYLISDIATIIGADERSRLATLMGEVEQLLIDSRSAGVSSRTLFFAIKTRNDDGHHYIPSLYNRGVRHFVVERLDDLMKTSMPEANFLVVESTVEALQALARHHRRRFNIPVIAITGSRGKTTVKEWLNTLIGDDYNIVRSPRSYNSQIGVPLSLWEIDDNTSMAIIEAGISTTGEMDILEDMIRPTIGVITNLGSEHNDGFASMEEKAREKAAILNHCETVVYPSDDPLVAGTIAPLLEAEVVDAVAWHRVEGADCYKVTTTRDHTDDEEFTPRADVGSVASQMSCIAVMKALGYSASVINGRLRRLRPIGTRLNVVEGVNNCTVIADGYTSDYNSLTPALDFMIRRQGHGQSTTVVLSDLQHDNMSAEELYIRVSELLKVKGVSRLIGVGEEMCRYGRYFTRLTTRFFKSTTEMLDSLSPSDFVAETVLVKGAPQFDFEQVVELLEARRHMTVEEIDLNALAYNFKSLRSHLNENTRTIAMVKADGYGTGALEVAKTLQDCGASYLAVAVQDEGVEMRRAGISMPIIVLNPSGANYKSMFAYKLEPEVYSLEECKALIKEGEQFGMHDFPVHIKIDSGMHRLGFTLEQLPALLKLLSRQNVLKSASVFSHLCVADEPEQDHYTLMQLSTFEQAAEMVQASCSHHVLRHVLNTAGVLRFPDYQMDMVRLGIGLYGINILPEEQNLRPVAALYSVIIAIKEHDEGTTIGYGRHGVLRRRSRIATVTIGYADGLDRHCGCGRIKVMVNGVMCPTVGNVCMDACMIDVTDVPDCKIGDRVEFFGPHVPIEQISRVRDTIPYEVLTSISPRVKRVYYRD